MYPVLVAAGGISTLLWDFRAQLLNTAKKLSSRRQKRWTPSLPASSSVSDSANEQIELENRASSMQGGSRAASVRNRMRSGGSDTSKAASTPKNDAGVLAEEVRHIDLMVLKKKLAIPLAVASIAVIIILVVVKSEISSPPRWLDFFVNMIIAGVIIFGGGPVVIPLLRQYTVAPGKSRLRNHESG